MLIEQTAADHLAHWKRVAPSYGFVYVIEGEPRGPVKIGKAVDVGGRIPQLQTGNPYPLRVLHILPGGRPLERQLHQRLAPYRMCGEWFQRGPEVADVLILIADVAKRAVLMGLKPSELVRFFIETDVPDIPPKPRPPEPTPEEWTQFWAEKAQMAYDSPFNPHIEQPPTFQPHRPTT